MKTSEPKPCPFCGRMPALVWPKHDDELVGNRMYVRIDNEYFYRCVGHGHAVIGPESGTQESALRNWNSREAEHDRQG